MLNRVYTTQLVGFIYLGNSEGSANKEISIESSI